MRYLSEKLARFIERHPIWFVILAVVISASSIPGLFLLKMETGFSALISPNDPISVNTARYQAKFGSESVNTLFTGSVHDFFTAANLQTLKKAEDTMEADPAYRSVTSVIAILELAVTEAQQQMIDAQQQISDALDAAAAQAKAAAAAAGGDETAQDLAAMKAKEALMAQLQPQLDRLEQMGIPSLQNQHFIDSVVYDANGDISETVSRFVPDENHILISVTPVGNLPDDDLLAVTTNIETILKDAGFPGFEINVVSHAKIINAISVGMTSNLKILLILSIVAMILVLVLLFRVRWRLLSLLMVGTSAMWTFGLMGYAGIPLTMTSMAVLPILIGLGIDFSIQFHNRYQEELTRSSSVHEAVVMSVSRMMPVAGIALIATIIGFITLYISEVPMIKDFGLVLAIGIVISYIVAVFLLHSIVVLADRKVPMKKLQTSATKGGSSIEKGLLILGRLAIRHTVWILVISIAFAVGGAFADRALPINTELEDLIPQDDPAVVELRQFREILGAGGSIKFMVEADDITDPLILNWMYEFQTTAVAEYSSILGTGSLASLVAQATGGIIPDNSPQLQGILAATPRFYVDQYITGEPVMTGISFTVAQLPIEDIHDLIGKLLDEADPPTGVSISPVGSMVIGAKTMDGFVGSRMEMNLICIGAMFLALLLVYRKPDRTIFSVLPVCVVIAWSSLDMFLIGIPLNPLTAILGVIIIGIGTEFMVMLTGRYEEEKENGLGPEEAMVTAISKIGRAIATTAATTLFGFGVLIFSSFVLVRDFGIATVVGVVLCLIIAITVMPGIIVWYDKLKLRRLANKKA